MNINSEKSVDNSTRTAIEQSNHCDEFAHDTIRGLSASPKYLFSKYFYDDAGSRIFQNIMNMQEYYLTDCELEILDSHRKSIQDHFFKNGREIDLVEPGAGDGLKTRVLIRQFLSHDKIFKYIPIDISAKAVYELVEHLEMEFPELNVIEKVGDYFKMMRDLNAYDKNPKVILFLGSNIGNYDTEHMNQFFTQLKNVMRKPDRLFIGFDLKKDPAVILNAYNDPHGHTSEFNLNLLKRINRELDANFNTSAFQHYSGYDPLTGKVKSCLISTRKQTVKIADKIFQFDKWEPIFTEISQKYDISMIHQIAKENGFDIVENFYDQRQYFVTSLWRPLL